jgi:hypothetical protein
LPAHNKTLFYPLNNKLNHLNLPMQQTSTLVSTSLKTTKNKQQAETHVEETPEPSDNLVQNILNYSKSLTIKKSDSVGFIEVVAS